MFTVDSDLRMCDKNADDAPEDDTTTITETKTVDELQQTDQTDHRYSFCLVD